MTWLELFMGRTPEPNLLAGTIAVFVALSLGTSLGLLVYALLSMASDSQDEGDTHP